MPGVRERTSWLPAKPPVLPWAEQVELFGVLSFGPWSHAVRDEAREKLVYHNLPLVAQVAKRWAGVSIAPMDDFLQSGAIGLLKAVDEFDPDMGVKFSTFAARCIYSAICKYVGNHEYRVRAPYHLVTAVKKKNEGEVMSDRERDAARAMRASCGGPEAVTSGGYGFLWSTAPTPKEPPAVLAEHESAGVAILRVFAALAPLQYQQREVVLRLYGIGRPPQTVDEIAAEMDLTPREVRGAHRQAKAAMRSGPPGVTAAPCRACGTSGGRIPKDQSVPVRSNGLCAACYAISWKTKKGA